jgi:GT2 family glycosyltransferase
VAASAVDVVIPVHDRWELTRNCLEHLRAQTRPHTAIVCDNGSTDGTPERLRAEFPDVRVVELGSNLGFSAACNRGVQAGAGDVVLLLNNDVFCRPDFLERLVAPLEADEKLGSVAALLVASGETSVESFGLTIDRTLAGFPRLRGASIPMAAERSSHLLGPCGAGGAYRRSAWDAVGGLDEGVLSYGEDVDLALRLRAAGWATTAALGAVAVHLGSATATKRSGWQRYQSGFARGYFLRRYGVMRSRVAARVLATEAIVVVADALALSHDLASLRGRVAGWRAARDVARRAKPPVEAIDTTIGFIDSLRLRLGIFTGRAGPDSNLPGDHATSS